MRGMGGMTWKSMLVWEGRPPREATDEEEEEEQEEETIEAMIDELLLLLLFGPSLMLSVLPFESKSLRPEATPPTTHSTPRMRSPPAARGMTLKVVMTLSPPFRARL